jgi:hypothetical protein
VKYWYGLFSHRRGVGSDRIWKGMLVTLLQNSTDDDLAREMLAGVP